MIKVFPSDEISPHQALLTAFEEVKDMEMVAIVSIPKNGEYCRLNCSTMKPVYMNFLGVSLQQYSLQYLIE